MSTNQRIRGRRLQRIRDRVLSENPLCVACYAQGIITPAMQVDHIVAVTHGGDDSAYNDSNRQALCCACHADKTRIDLGQRVRVACDVHGYPLGNHAWARGAPADGAVQMSTTKARKPAAQSRNAKRQ